MELETSLQKQISPTATYVDPLSDSLTFNYPEFLEISPHVVECRVLPVVIWPDARLHTKCSPVVLFAEYLSQLVADMHRTMVVYNGVGLAAPQVDILLNVIVIQIETYHPFVLVNPVIIEQSKTVYPHDEGCLSVPGYFEKRTRSQQIVVKYQNVLGSERQTEFQGLYAFVVQHEIDHLNGKVFVDGVSKLKEQIIKRRIAKTLKRRTKGG